MPSTRKKTSTHHSPQGSLVFSTRAISRRPGAALRETRTVPAPANLGAGLARIPEGSDLHLDVQLESVSEGVLVTVTATAPVTGECARCLEPVAQTLEVRSQELFTYEQDGRDVEEDEYSLDGDLLDIEPALRDALVLALPLAPKCQDDCPGLCAECGARLAQAGPDHRHDSAVDPRWAVLRQFKSDTGPDGSPVPGTRKENGRGRP